MHIYLLSLNYDLPMRRLKVLCKEYPAVCYMCGSHYPNARYMKISKCEERLYKQATISCFARFQGFSLGFLIILVSRFHGWECIRTFPIGINEKRHANACLTNDFLRTHCVRIARHFCSSTEQASLTFEGKHV